MVFHLAAMLGRTVGELVQTLTVAEFNYWVGYFKVKNGK